MTAPATATRPATTDRGRRKVLHVVVHADVELADETGLSVPTLCGAWINPDARYRARGLDGARPGGTRVCAPCMALVGTIPD